MGSLIGAVVLKTLKAMAVKLLAQELVEKLLIELLEWMAAKTDNKLDDKAVALVKEQLGK